MSSSLVCGEKVDLCSGPVRVFCVECSSYQCAACNAALHETSFATPQYAAHTRHPMTESESMCDVRLCKPIAEAEVTCQDCSGTPRLCGNCDRKRHRADGPRANHVREQYHGHGYMEQTLQSAAVSLDAEHTTISKSAQTNEGFGASNGGWDLANNLNGTRTAAAEASESARRANGHAVREDGRESDGGEAGVPQSFMLINGLEKLQISSAEELASRLGCETTTPVKVVSIVGNTGDGKSHTLNQLFFDGEEVFAVSAKTESCTMGVWIAFDRKTGTVVLDTEGMMGISTNVNERVRMLLKVLAVSDVIIYKTNAGRLHTDMFTFLSESSHAFQKHFSKELKNAVERSKATFSANTLAPAAIVFHQTQHTELLSDDPTAESGTNDQLGNQRLLARFSQLSLQQPEFGSLCYCGTLTKDGVTDFSKLRGEVRKLLQDFNVRTARPLLCMMAALKHLNLKFDKKLPASLEKMFPDEYFTCTLVCEACGVRCERTMNHEMDGSLHSSRGRCAYVAKLDNKVYLCMKCVNNSREVVVVPKTSSSQTSAWVGLVDYAWSGYVLECPHCGIIYRSRQKWFGNKDPTDEAVRTEIRHVWPGAKVVGTGTHNAARRLLEGLSDTAGVVSSASAAPVRILSDFISDSIAPSYWVPNSQIKNCRCCKKDLQKVENKHHCRACGQGFCSDCTKQRMCVEWRGWSPNEPVRVCDACFEKGPMVYTAQGEDSDEDCQGIVPSTTTRRVGEAMATAATAVASAMEYPKAMIKEAARPAYWMADEEVRECCVCSAEFTEKLLIHHCRSCGQGVCCECSRQRQKVPDRGWDTPVRVCDNCCPK